MGRRPWFAGASAVKVLAPDDSASRALPLVASYCHWPIFGVRRCVAEPYWTLEQ
jgi:hypothetical protein